MVRVAFVINSLEGGGAERAFCNILDGMCSIEPAIEPHLVLLDTTTDAYFPKTPLTVHRLDVRGQFLKSVVSLNSILSQIRPIATLSFLSRANCASILAARNLRHRAVISERVSPSSHLGAGPKGAVLRWVMRTVYPQADRVIAVSEGVKVELVANLNLPAALVDVIYNPIDVAQIQQLSRLPPTCDLPNRYIASVGRLTATKNFGMLLEGFARSGTSLDLVILGDGPERQALERLSASLGVANRVHFLGYQSNPFSILAGAKFFISASNAEGFPNALVEALAVGLPAAFTNCKYGPAEILTGETHVQLDDVLVTEFGVLIPTNDVAALARAFDFLSAEQNTSPFRSRASARAQHYNPERSCQRYLQRLLARPE